MVYNLNIDGPIGAWYYSQQFVAEQLKSIGKKPVQVRISSPGGSFSDALDIRQQFVDHGDVTAYIFGYTASAATIIAMGAKKVCMSKYAFFLMHRVQSRVNEWGSYNAAQLDELLARWQKEKESTEKADVVLAAIYAKKTGKSVEEIGKLMAQDTWLSAEEAKEYGLIDEIIEEGEEVGFENFCSKYNMYHFPALSAKETRPEKTADESPSWLARLYNVVDRLTGFAEMETENDKLVSVMNKEYEKVNTLLNVEGVDEKDGMLSLSAEQMKSINARLDSLENSLQAEKDKCKTLQSQVDALNKADGDESERMEGSEASDEADDISLVNNMYNSFKDFI